MKILMIIIRWEGGVGRIVKGVKKELESRGHNVKVLSREDDLEEFSSRKSFFKIREVVKIVDYDILYTQDWSSALPFLFFKNHYVCYHGLNPGYVGRFIQWLIGKLKGKNLIVVSENVGYRFKKANVIYNAVNPNEFYDLKKERKYLGWIKRSYDQFNENTIKVFGDKVGLEVSIAENIPPEKMNEWYNSLNLFVSCPPEYAGFNLCWLEAKLAGVPLVLGNDNGIGVEMINHFSEKFTFKDHIDKLLEVLK